MNPMLLMAIVTLRVVPFLLAFTDGLPTFIFWAIIMMITIEKQMMFYDLFTSNYLFLKMMFTKDNTPEMTSHLYDNGFLSNKYYSPHYVREAERETGGMYTYTGVVLMGLLLFFGMSDSILLNVYNVINLATIIVPGWIMYRGESRALAGKFGNVYPSLYIFGLQEFHIPSLTEDTHPIIKRIR